MDTWRVTPRLTVTPGLRLEINSGISEEQNRLTLVPAGTQSTLYPGFPPGVVVAGDAGLPNTLLGHRPTKLAPRVNFAYDVTGDGKTAVRGSVGLYYGRDVMALYETAFMHQPPFTGGVATARNGVLSNPWLTSQNPTYSDGAAAVHGPEPGQLPVAVAGLRPLRPQLEDYGLGSSTQWNVAVEREIYSGVRLEASYQGNSSTSTPTVRPEQPGRSGPTVRTDSSSNIQARRPDQFLGDNGRSLTNDGRTRFDQFLLHRPRPPLGPVRAAELGVHARPAQLRRQRARPEQPRLGQRRSTTPYYPDLMLDFQHNQTIAGFFTWDLPILREQHDGRRQDPRRLAAHGQRLLELREQGRQRLRRLRRQRRRPGQRLRDRQRRRSATRRRRSPARATCSTSGSTARHSRTRTARSTARSARPRPTTAPTCSTSCRGRGAWTPA